MTASLHNELAELAAETCCRYEVEISQQGISDIEKYILEPEAESCEESFTIDLDKDSSSSKLSNIRFNIGEFILETVATAQSAAGANGNWLALTLLAIRYVQKIKALARIPITKREAAVLMEVYRLYNENERITIDKLFALLGSAYSNDEIREALRVLAKLGSVSYREEGIELIEPISVIRA